MQHQTTCLSGSMPNHFAYLISYHLIINTVPLDVCANEPNVWTACPFVPKSSDTLPSYYNYRALEADLWHKGLKVWDPETTVAHIVFEKYIGPANRLFSTFKNRKSFNLSFLRDVETNRWFNPRIRALIFALYYKTHRVVRALNKFARIWRSSRAVVQVSHDLYMTPLDPKSKFTFRLTQNGSTYLFSLTDLTNIIVSSITHHNLIPFSYGLEHHPKTIKNPYNNIPLTKSDLFNIYFASHRAFAKINETFHRFFNCEFNIYRFANEERDHIEYIGITTFFNNMSVSLLAQNARQMFVKYASRSTRATNIRIINTQIHHKFPDVVLVKKLKPLLKLYFLMLYSINGKERYEPVLKRKMQDIMDHNPLFGQADFEIHADDTGIVSRISGYHDSVPDMDSNRTLQYFSQTHMYDDATNNRYLMHGDHSSTYDNGAQEIYENIFRTSVVNDEHAPPAQRARTVPPNDVDDEEEDNDEPAIVSETDSDSDRDQFEEHFDDTFDD